MRLRLRSRIILSFLAVVAGAICATILTVSWQLDRSTAAEMELLATELGQQARQTVREHHSVSETYLHGALGDVSRYGTFVGHKSPIAANIERQQLESVVAFLQNALVSSNADFALIFDSAGTLQASRVGTRAYKPGDLPIPSFQDVRQVFPPVAVAQDILDRELRFEVSPQEALSQEDGPGLQGFVEVDALFLQRMHLFSPNGAGRGGIAFVSAGVVRDEFLSPAGLYLVGFLLDDFDQIFGQILEGSDVTEFLFHGDTLIAGSGLGSEALEQLGRGTVKVGRDTAAEVLAGDQPVDVDLPVLGRNYFATCTPISDPGGRKIGFFCTGVPEAKLLAAQRLVLNHARNTQLAVQGWLLAIGAAIFAMAFVVARMLAGRITGPMEELVTFAKTVGRGDFSSRMRSTSVDEVGTVSRAIDTMLDELFVTIEKREKLEAQLLHGQKLEAVGTLAGGIAHDFNNILGAIMGYTELAQASLPRDSAVWEKLDRVLAASERAKGLVRQILTFSSKAEHSRAYVAPGELVAEIFELMEEVIPKTVELRSRVDEDLGSIYIDPNQFHQVVLNLCTNAYQALQGQGGGVIEVSLSTSELGEVPAKTLGDLKPGRYVVLTVRDSGPGIPPEILPRIFEPFFSTKPVGSGSGMGLAVVHGIVRSASGAVDVESVMGQGTTVSVYLPAHATEEGPSLADTGAPPRGNGRILWVDDETVLAELGAEALGSLGYDVVSVSSSREALRRFREAPDSFALVVTDQTMPELTGEQLAREILGTRPDTPIILCTGFSEAMDEKKAAAMGLAGFMLKPVRTADLARKIREVLRGEDRTAETGKH